MDGASYPFRIVLCSESDCKRISRDETSDVYAAEIQEKVADEVTAYLKVFKKKWKTLPGTSSDRMFVAVR